MKWCGFNNFLLPSYRSILEGTSINYIRFLDWHILEYRFGTLFWGLCIDTTFVYIISFYFIHNIRISDILIKSIFDWDGCYSASITTSLVNPVGIDATMVSASIYI